MEKLNAETVNKLFLSLLFQKGETANDDNIVVVDGIMNKFGLHKERVNENKDKIKALVDELHPSYRNTVGGGFTFLNMCYDKHGNQWTGFHRTQEELLVMGMAIDYMDYCLPRELWAALPGSMPYVVIKDGPNVNATEQAG